MLASCSKCHTVYRYWRTRGPLSFQLSPCCRAPGRRATEDEGRAYYERRIDELSAEQAALLAATIGGRP